MSGFSYHKNHHFIRLKNKEGQESELVAMALLHVSCDVCDFEFYSPTNRGVGQCPCCGSKMTRVWGRMQLCFVPERETDFPAPQSKTVRKPGADPESDTDTG